VRPYELGSREVGMSVGQIEKIRCAGCDVISEHSHSIEGEVTCAVEPVATGCGTWCPDPWPLQRPRRASGSFFYRERERARGDAGRLRSAKV